MKRMVLALLVSLMFVAPAVIFYVAGGRVKLANLALKQGGSMMMVRPTGIIIRPGQ